MPLTTFGEVLGETSPITVENIPWLVFLPEAPTFCRGVGKASRKYQHLSDIKKFYFRNSDQERNLFLCLTLLYEEDLEL